MLPPEICSQMLACAQCGARPHCEWGDAVTGRAQIHLGALRKSASQSFGATRRPRSRNCSFVAGEGASSSRSSARWFIGNMMT